MPFCTPVAQTLVVRGPGAMSMSVDAIKYVIKSQRTGLSGAACTVQMQKPKSTELHFLRIERQSIKHSQIIDGYPCVIIGRNPRLFLEPPGTVDTRSCLQNPQYVPLRDALTVLPPLSLPQISGKTSETGRKKTKTSKPLKMIELFGHQKLPKECETWSVITHTSSGLSVST